MATNLDYNVNVNATNGIQALNNLQTKVQALNSSFASFKNVIGGLALGGLIQSLIGFADSVKDLSDATGIATANILGFQKAVSLFGGTTEGAQKALLRLTQNIGEAAGGSAELQYAFGRVGVTLNDLATLSEQDILKKVIEGLGNVTNKSEAASLKAQLLGKEFRGVNTTGTELADTYAKITAEQEKNAAAVEAAAQLNDNLQTAIGSVKIALLEILQPLADFVNKLDQEKVNEFIKSLVGLVAVFAGFSVFGRAVALITELAAVFKIAEVGAIAFGLNLLKNLTVIGRVLTIIGAAVLAFKTAFPETAKSISDSVGSAFESIKEFFGFKPEDTSPAVDKNTKAIKENADATNQAGEVARKVVDPFKALREQISGAADDYAKSNRQIIDQINLTTSLIGLSRQEAEVKKINAEIDKKTQDSIDKLIEKKKALTEAQQAAGLGEIIDQQIAKIKEQAEADKASADQAVINSETRMNARKLEEFATKSQIDVEKDLRRIQDDIAKSTMSEIEKKQYDILAAARERAAAEIAAEETRRGSLMTDQEKLKYYEAAKKGSDELIAKERELYDKSRQFSTGWAKAFREYADNATNAARQAERIFSKVTSGLEDLIVNFVKTGKFEWKSFVASMLEELLRAQIQQIFAGLLGGMQDSMSGGGGGGGILGAIGSLFGLGGGGGGGRGSSPNSPVYVADVAGGGIGGMGGQGQQGGGLWDSITTMAGNVWSGVKNVFGGIADSVGSVFGGVASTVGNIFGGIADTAGSVFGSIGDTIGGAFGGITDTIGGMFGGGNDMGGGGISLADNGGGGLWDSISNGIGGLFDGWFANGGSIGKGKFGVVGENGPELVSGPATVTPLGGGTNVTYNINAVDAMSFKQMLAQDPSFIYALSLQGSSGIAGRR